MNIVRKVCFTAVLIVTTTSFLTTQLMARTLSVNCDSGRTLTQALSRAAPGDTVLVSGTCTETVTIATNDITVDGQLATIVDGGGGADPVMTIEGVRGVTVRNLTLINGTDGIFAHKHADMLIENVIAENNTDDGFDVGENSTVDIRNGTANSNGDEGFVVSQNSNINLLDGTTESMNNGGHGLQAITSSNIGAFGGVVKSTGNGGAGISIFGASQLVIILGTEVEIESNSDGLTVSSSAAAFIDQTSELKLDNNSRDGLLIVDNSAVTSLGEATVTNNGRHGILVFESSNLRLFGTNLIDSNGEDGLHVSRASNASLRGTLTISNNNRVGLFVLQTSMAFFEGGNLIIENSSSDGVEVLRTAQLVFQELTSAISVEIRNNGRHGVSVFQGSEARLAAGVTIKDNTSSGLHLFGNSGATVTDITMTNTGSVGVSSNGSTVSITGSTITGHAVDIDAGFGTVINLAGNVIGVLPISCDPTVLSTGDTIC